MAKLEYEKARECDHSFSTDEFKQYISDVPFNYCPWCGKQLNVNTILDCNIDEMDCQKGGCAD